MRSADTAPPVNVFTYLDLLPEDAAPLLAGAGSFFSGRAWWQIVLRHAIPQNAVPRMLLFRQGDEARAVFPMLRERDTGGGNVDFRAMTTPYTCLYEPLIAPGGIDRAAIFTAFGRYCRSFAITRMDALDQATATEIALGAKQAGLVVAPFNHFGNWHEHIAGLDWAAWLARRPGALRETIRRRTRRAEGLPGARFELFNNQNDMTSGVVAFETVYARSWKEPEPYPDFNPAQIRAAASLGLARVGVWWIGDTPAAAQFWIVEHGRATVLKLAHDETFKAHSPGTVLTAWMVRHVIEHEHATALDFGRGDDAYKQGWATNRRQMMGLMLINPRYPRGMIALARHTAGRVVARLRHFARRGDRGMIG